MPLRGLPSRGCGTRRGRGWLQSSGRVTSAGMLVAVARARYLEGSRDLDVGALVVGALPPLGIPFGRVTDTGPTSFLPAQGCR